MKDRISDFCQKDLQFLLMFKVCLHMLRHEHIKRQIILESVKSYFILVSTNENANAMFYSLLKNQFKRWSDSTILLILDADSNTCDCFSILSTMNT